MSDVKSFVFPENGGFGGSGIEGMLVGSMLNGGGMNGGAWGNPIWAIVFLAALRNGGLFGNGDSNQLSQIQDTLNTNQGNTLLMDAIKGNSTAIGQLANTLNCNHNAVQTAINAVQSAINTVGNQVGMGTAQVINSIQNGNMSLANTLQSCCCDIKTTVNNQGFENRIANLQQTNEITKGFGNVQFATQTQTTALAANQDANTRAVLAKIDAVQDEAKNNQIAELRAQVATLTSRAERQAELAPLYQKMNDIQCKLPQTVTLPYSCATAVPTSMVYSAFGLNPYANGGNFG